MRRVFPGVYRIGGARGTPEQRAVAALLWAGEDAVGSHATAAALWGIATPEPDLHVTAARRLTSPPQGVRTHVARLPKRDRGKLRGIPVTSPARTLLDLAGYYPEDRLLPLVERAILDGLVSAEQVHDVFERSRGRRGCRRLARVLHVAGSSALERRVESLLRSAGLPPYRRELSVDGFRLDFAWPAERVAIEADGRRWHSSAVDFERDRAKSNALTEHGWRVLRVTPRDLEDPGAVVDAVERLLADG